VVEQGTHKPLVGSSTLPPGSRCQAVVSEGSTFAGHGAPRRQRLEPSLTIPVFSGWKALLAGNVQGSITGSRSVAVDALLTLILAQEGLVCPVHERYALPE
jgi:hypothetical protein